MGKKVEINVYFEGRAGSPKDKVIDAIIFNYGGTVIAAGTSLAEGVRDLCVEVEHDKLGELFNALKQQGCWFDED